MSFFGCRQSPVGSGSGSPVPCGPPEYLIAPYRPGDYEYVGVPLEPGNQGDEEATGPSTAEIIASQSQDYVDEKLAEYQATIQQLQGEFLPKNFIYSVSHARGKELQTVCSSVLTIA